MIDKRKLKEFTRKVDAVLWEEWDPIGAGVPRNEYTSYALVVAGRIWNDESRQSVLDYLYLAESKHMGLNRTQAQTDRRNGPIVDRLIQMAREHKA